LGGCWPQVTYDDLVKSHTVLDPTDYTTHFYFRQVASAVKSVNRWHATFPPEQAGSTKRYRKGRANKQDDDGSAELFAQVRSTTRVVLGQY